MSHIQYLINTTWVWLKTFFPSSQTVVQETILATLSICLFNTLRFLDCWDGFHVSLKISLFMSKEGFTQRFNVSNIFYISDILCYNASLRCFEKEPSYVDWATFTIASSLCIWKIMTYLIWHIQWNSFLQKSQGCFRMPVCGGNVH